MTLNGSQKVWIGGQFDVQSRFRVDRQAAMTELQVKDMACASLVAHQEMQVIFRYVHAAGKIRKASSVSLAGRKPPYGG